MESRHNTTQDQPIVNVTDDTSNALLRMRTLAPPVCTAADSPTANSGRGMMNARRSIRGRWCSMAILIAFAAMLAVCALPASALTCEYDMCVNETGWWNASGAFNAGGTPIQAAVDNATAGYTIFVWNGSYTENVDVNKQLTLRGAGVVNVTNRTADSHVFNVTADYVNISGFNVTGATGSANAGIYLGGRQHCNISNNNALGNYYGIYLISSSNNMLTDNTANSNNKNGIYLYSASNYNTLANNTANSNSDQGIYLKSSSNNTLANNTASNNIWQGICLESSSNNNTLTNNTANSNTQFGILLSSSSSNTLANNTANLTTKHGIYLYSSSNFNTLSSNTASNNLEYGIYLHSSSSNTLLSNTANSNTNYGIYLLDSSSNTIYNNYFNNANNANDSGNNIWNTTPTTGTNIIGGSNLGGNYWSDYTGSDTNGDGLGDNQIPYNSSGDITNGGDHHPLVTPGFAAPNITSWSNNKTNDTSLDITVNISENVNFNATANQSITTWSWYDDGANQSHNYNNITLNWSSSGLKTVIVNATNTNGTSNTVTWTIIINYTTPPAPTNLQSTTSNYWVNHTWTVGTKTGIVTDGYNVSMNGWHNTTETFLNSDVGAGNWSNITVWAWNATGDGNMSVTNLSGNVRAPAETTPPASITGLTNTTYEQTYINWTWTDPGDADFAKVMVYIDGASKGDVLKAVGYYNATGFTPGTEHTISTHTVDASGNVNATWKNDTAWTEPSADTTAPASITNLQNTTYEQTYINWTWTDPGDADFAKVMVYIDGASKGDVLKAVGYYNATGFTPGTEHTISTHTVDASGNVNATWKNDTAWTEPSADTTAPASITNLQNTTYEQTYINWTWTDPGDADFAKVMVYIDGASKGDVLKAVGYYNATGFTPGTEHTISTHTVDASGNVNATWKNDTAWTEPSADTTAPASITNLQNTTYEQTYINWTWTDPGDADFAKVMVYIDGASKGDVLKAVGYYNATGFTPGTEHTISTHTVDASGNVNATWKNDTAWTEPSADTTAPASITNLQNTTYEQTYINWTWTDPGDADFAKVMVYIDGASKGDVLKAVGYYNATGFTPGTEHTISTHTVDASGNVNATWKNDTAWTEPSADTTAPASITNLQNTTYEQTYINWTWTDPGDADFAKVMVYIDGASKGDVLKAVGYYNATGFTPGTEHTISTHTVDASGNVNATWKNDTAWTEPSADTTAPASITNLQNTTYEQTYINWTWTDPGDADFAKVMVYIDGASKGDVLKAVGYYNATGFTPGTEHTISTHTVDASGNVNATWKNDTAWTEPSADTTAPASITNLQNTTYEQTYINWTWTDPGDADFAKVMVYIDGASKGDVLKAVGYYNATGFTPGTEHTISTHTVDASGNVNATWKNDTAWTEPSADTTAPASITNLQNTTYEQTYINWTWTDPGDADFAKVMVYIDGASKGDVLKAVGYYNATGFTPGTEHTISTHTVDASGNVNATWKNDTAWTEPSADTTAPASITNLQNTTYEQTYINWTWTDPGDADFAKVMVYIDGASKGDVLKAVGYYNATGFTPGTEHTISTHTVDASGNVNATWKNDTAWTEPSADTTAPASITNLQNTTYEQTYINWTWTDPGDADFAKVMVYIDGASKGDVLKAVGYYNATGFTPGTEHTISTHTVDASGNVNATWKNDTAWTEPSADTTAPASITNLQNTTYEQTYINWTWTDPGDADFAKVMVYIDGASKGDVLKAVGYYNATGFTPGTEHTISTHTVDASGNVNATWKNDTARTEPSADTTAPASITNLQNTTYEQTYINWTWTDPGDADFAKVMVYIDGASKGDVLKAVGYYNATGFTPGTEHTISTHTVDASGNVNATWKNDTAWTEPSADTTAPASITNLQNTTYEQTYINWTWTDPGDADFAKVMVYIDGASKGDVLKAVGYYNATGFTPGTEHTISTHTVDASGNVNATWKNDTAWTEPSADTTAPASITNLQNTTYEQTYINWTWTDPGDADFAKVMVYIDGASKGDVLKAVGYYNATGFTPGTEHTISTHTVDASGNVNATWKNDTARTYPQLRRINVTPTSLTMNIDESVDFNATGFDQNNTEISGLVFEWYTTPSGIGTLNDTTGSVVNFTALHAGRTEIYAVNDGISSNATDSIWITVNAPPETKNVTNGTGNATSGNSTATVKLTNTSVNGTITIKELGDPINGTEDIGNQTGLGNTKPIKGVNVTVNESIKVALNDTGSYVHIRIEYNGSQLGNIDENTLYIYKFVNGTGWVRLVQGSNYCIANGRNTTADQVWVNVTNCSILLLTGTPTATPTPSSSTGGGGSGTYPPGWFETPTPTVTATKAPTGTATDAPSGERVTPTPAKRPDATKTTTPTATETAKTDTPGLTAVFAIAGLLAVAYAMMRRRE